jgi:beta-lactamase class D
LKKLFSFLIAIILLSNISNADTQCFLAMENNKVLKQEGDCESRYSPRSSFKIPLSLMGFDAGFFIDESNPELPFKEGYYDYLEIWKQSHTPSLWMKHSCVWYSQVLTKKLGMKKFQKYVRQFNYGNQDVSGDKGKNNGLDRSWLSSSLKISCREQVLFLQKFLHQQLHVKSKAYTFTKNIIFVDELMDGWKLYGKTGTGNVPKEDGTLDEKRQGGWFVGWVEKGSRKIVFACYLEQHTQDLSAGQQAKIIAQEKLIRLVQESRC